MRGLGQVGTATVNALVSYYGFALPLAFLYTFVMGGGLDGLWYGIFSGQLILCIIYQYFISVKFDWEKIV